ncbi:MAG: DUF4381 family protein [Terrimicrobiaceae bacterium]|nr:DUF4381 family protein [Terrimicrobiaceae bacterium]
MSPQALAAPTPAPIHDIVGPIAFFPYPIWEVVVAVPAALILIGAAIWFFTCRRGPSGELTPAERALAALAGLRGGVGTTDPYAFSIVVSDVLRSYLRDARGLSATTQTSREFLETVRTRQAFNDAERDALAAFLEKADLIKFARMHATPDDCSALLEQADRLVRSGAPALQEAGAK